MTVAAASTSARRAKDSSGFSCSRKRSSVLSRPLFHNPWNAAAVVYEEDGTPVEVMFRETEPAAVPAGQKSAEQSVEQVVVKPAEKTPAPAVGTEEEHFYTVQLVSTRSDSAAESEWKRLSKKFKEIIAGQPHFISKTVVASGTFYRLRVGRFKKHEEAKALCDQLKVKKQECFVVK